MKNKILYWFRNDLRLHDNEAFFRANENGQNLLPFYCFDPRVFQETALGFPKTDSFRAKFMIEAVSNLKYNLQKKGSDLLVLIGKPERVIPELIQKYSIDAVYCSKEVTQEEVDIEQFMEQKLWKNGVQFETFWTSTLYHLEDLPFPIQALPNIFTQFRKAVEKEAKVRPCFPEPLKLKPLVVQVSEDCTIPNLNTLGLKDFKRDERSVLDFTGGEDDGLERLRQYFWQKSLLKTYKKTRNGLLGADYSSKFSAWLSLGCLSPRKIYKEVKKYEKAIQRNQSTYWLVFELIWRDYFRFVAKKFGSKIFLKQGIKNNLNLDLKNDLVRFDLWKEGKTGLPFIDANMKELALTGFMSNRGRQNVASYLVKDLKINWTWGAAYFESKLIDYDVCSNWGNWLYVAGVGNDPRENRYFNVESQAQRYDPKGAYVSLWLEAS